MKLEIDEALAERLRVAAAAAGQPVEQFALQVLDAFADPQDGDWAIDVAIAEEFDRTGEAIPLEEALRTFRAAVERGPAGR